MAPSASLLYYANVVLHPILGILFGLALLSSITRRVWLAGTWGLVGLGALMVGLTLGMFILVLGATKQYEVLLFSHVLSCVIATLCILVEAWQKSTKSAYGRLVRVLVITVCVLGMAAPMVRDTLDSQWYSSFDVENPIETPASMDEEGAGTSSPFYPSSVETTAGGVIASDFFLTSEMCGRCHRDIYEQWRPSAHHFSSFNNQWYRKSIEYMQDVVGTEPSKWCAGCHDHALLCAGQVDEPIKDRIFTPEAQAGLGCVSCHSVVHVKSTMGQGDFVIEYPPLHNLATSENPVIRFAHDALVYLSPEPHRRTFMKPFHREKSAEFCSTCHKVHLDVPVNDYRWQRGFNSYDNWQASGVSGEGARSFYYPSTPQTCRDCHMPLVPSDDPAATDGLVRSHRFPGANTALPFVNGDEDQLEVVQQFLKDDQVSVDIFGNKIL